MTLLRRRDTRVSRVVIGADPGLGNFGLAAVDEQRALVGTAVVSTRPDHGVRYRSGKRWSYPVTDMLRRVRELHRNIEAWMSGDRWKPVAICSESPSFGMSGIVGVRQSAMAWGVLVSIASRRQLPLVVKGRVGILNTVCGRRGSKANPLSKKDVVLAVAELYGYDDWPKPGGVVEHAADAAAAVWACWDDERIKEVLR